MRGPSGRCLRPIYRGFCPQTPVVRHLPWPFWGGERERLEGVAKEQGLDVTFTGDLPYPKMVATLCECDFAVNPIRRGAASIINKVGDYAAAALAVVNTQECEEYRALLEVRSRKEDEMQL